MFRRDYIMRILEQATAVAMEVARLGRQRAHAEAFALTSGVLREQTGVDADRLLQVPLAALLDRLSLEDELAWTERAVIIATVLHAEAELYRGLADAEAADRRALLALGLLLAVLTERPGATLPAGVPPVSRLLQELQGVVLPGEVAARLLRYYEAQGAYARAEDCLFAWRDAEPGDPAPVKAGVAFYQRLLALDDAALDAGNLPRAEVAAGLAELTTAPDEP